MTGTGLFAAASLGCAFAPGFSWLLAGRAMQGIGAALLLPNSLAILGASFDGAARGRAVGIWAAMGAVMAAVGPVLGGWLIDHVGWAAIFLINLPPALGAIALAWFFVREGEPRTDAPPLDMLGGVLTTVGLGAVTWGLTMGSGPSGWTQLALAALVIGIAFLVAFLAIEKIRKTRAMMPLSLFASRDFVGLTVLTLLLYGALGALVVLVPYVLIRADHYSGIAAGAALLPLAVILAAGSPAMGSIAGRTGPRGPLTLGPMIAAGGFFLLLRVGTQSGYWAGMFPAIATIGVGMVAAVAPLTTAVLSSVDRNHTGAASGLNSAVARIAGMIATALLGGVLGLSGSALVDGFHEAALFAAAACLAASGSAFILIGHRVR